ncbi:MAG: hypothetical protein ACPLW7_05025 [Minisyncoccia bacterium]
MQEKKLTNLGKEFRLKRVIDQKTNTSIIIALDHGMTSPTFLDGLFDMKKRVKEAMDGGADVIMMSKGFAHLTYEEFRKDRAWAMLLTASALGTEKLGLSARIGTVEEALILGADAVVVFVPLATENEKEVIEFVAEVGKECERLGMVFIAEAEYPTTYESLDKLKGQWGFDYLMRNARLCTELGADIVKVNWSGDPDSFAKIIQATKVPVVVAGGTKIPDEELLERMEFAKKAGAIGCSVGRNMFQHKNPFAMTRALVRIFKEDYSAKEALKELKEAV